MDPHLEKKWFVYLTDHHEGPFSLEEVKTKLDDGTVTKSHYFWCDGMADWQVMTEIDELAGLEEVPSRPPNEPQFTTPQDIDSAPANEPSPQMESHEVETFVEGENEDTAAATMELGNVEATETVPVDSAHAALPTAELSVEAPPQENVSNEDESSFDLPKLEDASASMEVADPNFAGVAPKAEDETFPGAEGDGDFSMDTQGNLAMPDSSGKSGKIDVQPSFSSTLPADTDHGAVGSDVSPATSSVAQASEAAPQLEVGGKKSKGRFKKLLVAAIVVGGGYYVISQGWLNSLGGPDSITRKVSEQLVQWVPSLSKWVSPVPDLEDVDPIEYRFLEQAAYADPKNGIKTAVALSNKDLNNPHFYIGSNMPDFTLLEVHVVGIEDTLLNHYDVHVTEEVIIKNHWGRTKAIRFKNQDPLPAGEYEVYVFEGERQERSVQEVLNTISPSNENLGEGLPSDRKIVFKKTYFLGGKKDDAYKKRLKAFHDRLQAKAKAEIAELKKLADRLKAQYDSLFGNFERLRNLNPPGRARRDWEQFDRQWRQSMSSLDAFAQKWSTPSALRIQYYGRVYQIITELVPALKQVEAKLGTFFTRPPSDLKQFEIDYSHDKSRFETSITTLQAVISRIEKTQPSPNGMPVRLPLKNTAKTGA